MTHKLLLINYWWYQWYHITGKIFWWQIFNLVTDKTVKISGSIAKILNSVTKMRSLKSSRCFQSILFQMILTVILIHFVILSMNVKINWSNASMLTPLKDFPAHLRMHFHNYKDCFKLVQTWKSTKFNCGHLWCNWIIIFESSIAFQRKFRPEKWNYNRWRFHWIYSQLSIVSWKISSRSPPGRHAKWPQILPYNNSKYRRYINPVAYVTISNRQRVYFLKSHT